MGEALSSVFGARRFDFSRSNRFFGQASRIQLRHIGFDFCSYGVDVTLEFPGLSFLRQQFCLSGSGETVVGGTPTTVSRDESSVIPEGRSVTFRYANGFKQLVLRVDPAELLRKMESLTGTRPQGTLEFCRDCSFDQPNLNTLRKLVLFFVDEIGDSTIPCPELVRVEFEQTLLVAFLHGHRHNFSHLFEKRVQAAASWQVRAAEAYIEANWNQPITIEAIATAAGVSVRSLFNSFSASRHGCSPMVFVRTVRLRHAQEILRRPEPTTTVSATAFACGFQNLGHFARQYQLLIGELPSETLARARRAQ